MAFLPASPYLADRALVAAYNLTTMRLETNRWPKPVPVWVCDASPCPLSVWQQRLFPNATAAG